MICKPYIKRTYRIHTFARTIIYKPFSFHLKQNAIKSIFYAAFMEGQGGVYSSSYAFYITSLLVIAFSSFTFDLNPHSKIQHKWAQSRYFEIT